MSRVKEYYLMRNEAALERQQLIQDKLNAQDTFSPEEWWERQDSDAEYQKECERMINAQPF